MAGRSREGACGADDHEHRVDRRETRALHLQPDEQPRADAEQRVTRGEHRAAIEALGGEARERPEERGRQKLREPHPAEIERLSGERVHLPADGDALHLRAEQGKETGGLVAAKIHVPQRRGSGEERFLSVHELTERPA